MKCLSAGNKKAGNYTEFQDANKLWPCVEGCCEQKANCNVAFIFNDICYHVQCINNELCLPSKRSTNITTKLRMVLVNPVDGGKKKITFNVNLITNNKYHTDLTWLDVLKVSNFDDIDAPSNLPNSPNAAAAAADSAQSYFDKYDDVVYGVPYDSGIDKNLIGAQEARPNLFRGFSRFDQFADDGDQQMEESNKYYSADTNIVPCEISAAATAEQMCPENEECIQLGPKSRQGICNCARSYVRNEHGKCLKLADGLLLTPADSDALGSTTAAAQKLLTVSVVSKTVRLPEQEVTLSAYTIPDEKSSGDTYKYVWLLISQPSGDVNGTMSDQTKDNIKLSKLSEGLYRFKVVVTGTNAYGDAYANVTVSPEKRINRAPIVRITPEQQMVKLPTSKAILDGSASTVSQSFDNKFNARSKFIAEYFQNFKT